MTLDPPARVLILMDYPVVADMVALTLNHGRFLARVTAAIPEAASLMPQWRPHLAVVDMDLGDGGLLRQLGVTGVDVPWTVPVLGLTRRGDLKTKLDAFEQGVDDIMTVPFSPEELLARALVITRQSLGRQPELRPTIRVGVIEIDILRREVRAGESIIHLSGLEQSLLYLLAANAGKVITRDQILDALWGTDFVAESNIVDRHVRGLRVKLQNDWRRPRFIATVPGQGYRFIPMFDGTHDPSSSPSR